MSDKDGLKIAAATTKEAPATVAQIAALQFEAVRELRDLPKDERQKRAYKMMNGVMPHLCVAVEFVSLDKDELVGLVESRYDDIGPLLMEISEANECLDAIRDVLRSAEIRLATALAIIEGGDDGGGGGESETVAA